VGGIFAPSDSIDPATLPGTVLGNINLTDNTVNSALDIVLLGDATAVNSTNITLVSSLNPSEFGKAVTFTATVTSGTTGLSGSVTFTDTFGGATTQLGAAVALNSSGVATYTSTSLAVGVHTISASYSGDTTHLTSSAPATLAQTVTEHTRTALTAAPKSPSALGGSVTFTATVSVTDGGALPLDGTVTFSDSLTPLTGNTVAVTGGVATFTTSALIEGVNVITATYTPDSATLIQGSFATLSQDVVSPTTTTITSSPNPSTYGSPVTFSVTVPTASGATAATGKVNIVITAAGQSTPTYPLTATLSGSPATGSAAISTLPVGSYTAVATYVGDTNYATSTASLAAVQVVNQVGTSTAAVATPNPGIAGKPVAIAATVAPATGTVAPTGTVTFADTFNGTTTTLGAGSITLSGGKAAVNPTLAAGTHSILVSYSGDSDDAQSSVTLSLVVNQATTATVVTATPNPATVGGTITFTATVTGNGGTPAGTVNFLANGTIALGTGTLDGKGATTVTNNTLAAGTYTITAVYAGDTNDTASTSPSVSEVVGTIPTLTSLTTASTAGPNSQTILVSTVQNDNEAGPTPTGTVVFKNGSNTIGQAKLSAGGSATLTPNLGAGNYSIVAYYGGDALHGVSQSSAVSVTSTGSSYTLTVAPGSVTVPSTQNAVVTVTLTSISGFNDTIGLGCGSLPAGVNCHFSTDNAALAANGTANATLTIDTNNPLGGGATAMNQTPTRHTMEMAGMFLPFSLLMGWMMWRFRKRNSSVWSLALILMLSGAALAASGCGGFTQTSAAPGTYTVQVVGVGANSNVTAYQNVTLTITK
jgi:hypothetical protein